MKDKNRTTATKPNPAVKLQKLLSDVFKPVARTHEDRSRMLKKVRAELSRQGVTVTPIRAKRARKGMR